ncbi:outer membrane beta-barrel protein [Paludibacterium sp.]|uniref:outer membrane beta-barrel protein n=1 Tax=Paludibacterium sp. TaxID=1917523 RepID=UPI0025CC0F0A|nr:outer membrane beta-barrel protein [Paludibacterium sp.]
MKKFALIVIVSALAAPAMAEGFYVLGSVGQSHVDWDTSYLDNSLAQYGVHASKNDTDTAYKLQLGYQLNRYFAIEGGYVDLGKASYSIAGTGSQGSLEYKASGVNAVAVGILPLNDQFSVFGKVGGIVARVEGSGATSGSGVRIWSNNPSSTDLKGTWGVGVNWDVTRNVAVRAEFEQFHQLGSSNTGEADVNLASMGVAYKF